MSDEISDAAMPDNPDDGWNIPAFLLMTGGVLLVMFASSLGVALVHHDTGGGRIEWSPDEANAMAITLRCLGGLAFVGGCIERIVRAIAGTAREDTSVSGERRDNSDLKITL